MVHRFYDLWLRCWVRSHVSQQNSRHYLITLRFHSVLLWLLSCADSDSDPDIDRLIKSFEESKRKKTDDDSIRTTTKDETETKQPVESKKDR